MVEIIMPTIHGDLIKDFAALVKRVGSQSSPELVSTEMLRLVNQDIADHPDLWPNDLEGQMAEASVLISEHFS